MDNLEPQATWDTRHRRKTS